MALQMNNYKGIDSLKLQNKMLFTNNAEDMICIGVKKTVHV